MLSENQLLLALAYSAAAAMLFLTAGALAVLFRRQPIERLRLIQWTLLACLFAPLGNRLPGLPQWSLAVPTAAPQSTEHAQSAIPDSAIAEPTPRENTLPTTIPHEVAQTESRSSEPTTGVPSNVDQSFDNTPTARSRVESSASSPSPLVGEGRGEGRLRTGERRVAAVGSPRRTEDPRATTQIAAQSWPWTRIMLAAYAFGVVAMLIWYLIGLFTLVWLNATARAGPDEVAKQFRATTSDPAALRVRLCMHPRVELPLAYGLIRPTILLPESMCTACISSPSPLAEEGRSESNSLPLPPGEGRGEGAAAALRYSLLHEWSHLARGDAWRWRLSTVVGILFFYQPLYWWLRRQQRLCQDFLADSHAATASSPSPPAGEGRGEGAATSTAREDYAQFLVNLAHRRLGITGALALSICDCRSNLYRRVQMLLENRQPLAQHLRWPRRIAIAAAAIAMIAATSGIRLTAEDTKPSPEPAAQAKADAAHAGTAEVTCTGEVRDALVGKPIAGAKLTIRKLDQPNGILLKQFTAETNADGKYTIELPTDHPWQQTRTFALGRRETIDIIPLDVEINRSGYAPLHRLRLVELNGTPSTDGDESSTVTGGFSVSPATTDDEKHKTIELFELRPGHEVSGTLQSVEGKPIAGVKVFAHSMVPRNERSIPIPPRSGGRTGVRTAPPSEDESITNPNGKFRVTMISPGEGMIWITPDSEFAPQARVLYDQRGDLGIIKLQRGLKIEGRVLDIDGKPLSGVYVNAYPWNNATPEYSGNVEQQIHRAAETDAQGRFTLAPLAPGDYRIEPQEFLDSHPAILRHDDSHRRPLPAMFVPQKLTLAGDHAAQLEIRAVPTVTVEGRIYDGANVQELVRQMNRHMAPSSGNTPPPVIDGKINGLAYRAVPLVEDDGTFKFSVPRGLMDVRLSVSPYRNGSLATPPRWRLGTDKPINSDSSIILGSLDENVRGIEIDYSNPAFNNTFGPDAPPATGNRGRSGARGRGAPPFGAGGSPGSPAPASGASSEKTPAELTVSGIVQDADTKQSIEAAEVTVWVKERESPDFKRLCEVKSDAAGKFSFLVQASLAKQVSTARGDATILNLEFHSRHPNYAMQRVYTTVTVAAPSPPFRINEGGAREVRMPIEMQRGEPVTAVLKTPDGKPAAGVKINRDNKEDAITDQEGRFHMNFPKTGNASFFIDPRSAGVPAKYQLYDKRGDIGVITLQPGPTIKGRVVDTDGKPLAGIYVRAMGPYTRPPESGQIFYRATMTDTQGNVSFAPLSAGDYRVEPWDSGGDPSTARLDDPPLEKHPLPGYFAPQKVSLVDGQQPKPIEFRPTRAVVIEGQVKGVAIDQSATPGATPSRGRAGFGTAASTLATIYERYKPKIFGVVDGLEYEADVTIDADGKFTAKIPQGATDVQVQLANQQGPRVRAGIDKPLVVPGAILLGTVNEDVHGVEIVYP